MAADALHEPSYLEGERAALRAMLSEILRRLDVSADAPQRTIARLTKEREDTIAALRRVCRDHGDNEWDGSLYLADVVEKHLAKHLDEVADVRAYLVREIEEVKHLSAGVLRRTLDEVQASLADRQ